MYSTRAEILLIFLAGTIVSMIFIAAAFIFIYLYQNKRLKYEQELRKKEEDHQLNVLTAVLQGQENEQRRLASELHDGVAVEIASISSFVHHLKPHLITSESSQDSLYRVTNLLEELYRNIRKISHGLLPANIEKQGLVLALKDFINHLNLSSRIQINLIADETDLGLSVEKELLAYRIIQELIQNAKKHSKGTEIRVKIDTINNQRRIEVSDNGVGFSRKLDDPNNEGIGMKSIEARVKLLSGEFNIVSNENTGTKAIILF